MVVVYETEESSGLADALQAVKDKGRRSVLVAPAVFCADAETMRRLSKEAQPFEDTLDLEWLPGLGGRLYKLASK